LLPAQRGIFIMTESTSNRACLLIRSTIITMSWLLGLLVLIRFAFIRTYNYDELSHAHMTWLVSIGEVPYRDFAINHFPFFWMLACPLMKVLPQSHVTMMILRCGAMFFNTIFLASLGTLICHELQPRQRIWAVACFGLTVFHPLAIHYLIEFRPDAPANALLFLTLACLKINGAKNITTAFVSGLLIGVAILVNTKYGLFPLILGMVTIVIYARSTPRIWTLTAFVCLGFGTALLVGMALMASMSIKLADAWRMVVTYNAAVEKAHTFGWGLANAITLNPVWLAFSLAGILGCAIVSIRQRIIPGVFSIAILLFLIVNLLLNTRPWKQYVVSWFLLAAYFPARFLSQLSIQANPKIQAGLSFCVLTVIFFELSTITPVDPNFTGEVFRATQDRVIDFACQHIAPDAFVLAGFPLHPIFRRDTFFKVVIDMTVDGNDGFEQFMPLLTSPPYSEHFQRSGYKNELRIRPPSIIINQSFITQYQRDALDTYLKAQPDNYDLRLIEGTSIPVLERK
jgi:hypothetical protein